MLNWALHRVSIELWRDIWRWESYWPAVYLLRFRRHRAKD